MMAMSMAKNRIRALPLTMAAVTRSLCTAAVAAAGGGEYKPLYRRLSALGLDPNGRVAETMEGWLKEGRVVLEAELMRNVRELRKHKSYKTALEVKPILRSCPCSFLGQITSS